MSLESLWLSRFVVYALAAFRITYALWAEDGPYDVLDWLRFKMGVTVNCYDDREDNSSQTGRLFNCPLCLSMWVSTVAVICFVINEPIIDGISMVFALSGVCVVLMGYERNK